MVGYDNRCNNANRNVEDDGDVGHEATDFEPDPEALLNLERVLQTPPDQRCPIEDINDALETQQCIVTVTQPGDYYESFYLRQLALLFHRRYVMVDDISDLTKAIDNIRHSLSTASETSCDRAPMLSNLGKWLSIRFQKTRAKSAEDIESAVKAAKESVDLTHDDRIRPLRLFQYSEWLGMHCQWAETVADAKNVIQVMDKVVEISPREQIGFAFANRGMFLAWRSRITGSINDINSAIDDLQRAIDASHLGTTELVERLCLLSGFFGLRFNRLGSTDDINLAVQYAYEALAISKDHPNRAKVLNTLANRLGSRFSRTKSINDLDDAIVRSAAAITAAPEDDVDLALWQADLGAWLFERFRTLNTKGDLDNSIYYLEEATNSPYPPHLTELQAIRLSSLGRSLALRYKHFSHSIEDLESAIEKLQEAVNLMPVNHGQGAIFLTSLGYWITYLDNQILSTPNYNRALSCFKQSWTCRAAPPSIRIRSALNASILLANESHWKEASILLRDAVELLPTVSPRSLQHVDKQHMLSDFAGLASAAAAFTLNADDDAYQALRLLETGRGVITSLLLDLRGDISDLHNREPELADRFIALRDEIESPPKYDPSLTTMHSAASLDRETNRRYEADAQLAQLIHEIREIEGFSRFLQPPTEMEIKATADTNPIVVINLDSCRCDAFLVTGEQIKVLPLPKLRIEDVEERARTIRMHPESDQTVQSLEWLWDVITGPCLDEIGYRHPVGDSGDWPHVWWIPTGPLCEVPLHAAGYHTSASRRTVLDRVISSYALSVTALIKGRRRPHASSTDRAVLVAMPQTAGYNPLHNAMPELDMVKNICPLLNLQSVTPTARKDPVLSDLRQCKIFHFAGHGDSDKTNPSKSRLVLEDWKSSPLTMEILREENLHDNPPFLGYLSACSTASNELEAYTDEGINIAGALQLAGLRHIIATLWSVQDSVCVEIARVLYNTMAAKKRMDDATVSLGLHLAMRKVRSMDLKRGSQRLPSRGQDEEKPATSMLRDDADVICKSKKQLRLRPIDSVSFNSPETAELLARASHDGLINGDGKISSIASDGERSQRALQKVWVSSKEKSASSVFPWVQYIHFGV